MKPKLLLLVFGATIVLNIGAQTPSIPNGNFETWSATTFEVPQNYIFTSNVDALRNNLPFNVIKSTDAYHGNYAVQMTTEIANGDTMPGIFINVDPKNGNPANWHGGFAYNQKPTGMHGYYKSAIAFPDTGFLMAFFYKAGVNIGQYGFYFTGTHNTYTPFSFNFIPALPQNPDTIIFGAGSSNYSNMANMRHGSMLMLDSISFTGVSSQPALFNGDFETWQSTTIEKPTNWFSEGGGGSPTGGVYKTTDAKAGTNAIELITYEGERNNAPAAQPGSISTGWYPNNCSSNCYEHGGYPFSNQIDTLTFWYKYSPSSGSGIAQLYLNFKKNGNNIWGTGLSLSASANYQYMEIPFNIGQIPDTTIINIQSSQWQDSSLTFVGSNLKIDEVHFKSQPLSTGIFNFEKANVISIHPNPTNGDFHIDFNNKTINNPIEIEVFDAIGKLVLTQTISTNHTVISLEAYAKGIYTVRLKTDGSYSILRVIKE